MNFLLHDYAWEESRFRSQYPGVDPDLITEAEYEDLLILIPALINFKEGKPDFIAQLNERQWQFEEAYRNMFAKGFVAERDEDTL